MSDGFNVVLAAAAGAVVGASLGEHPGKCAVIAALFAALPKEERVKVARSALDSLNLNHISIIEAVATVKGDKLE